MCALVRGHRADYDSWANLVGDKHWSYENMLPYFKKSEDYYCGVHINKSQHGFEGPIHTVGGPRGFPLEKPIKKAFESIGFKYKPDYNIGD